MRTMKGMTFAVLFSVFLLIFSGCEYDGGGYSTGGSTYGNSSDVVRSGTERESSSSKARVEFTVVCKGHGTMEFAEAGAYITVWPESEPGRKMMVQYGKGRGCGLPTFWLDGGSYQYEVELDGYERKEGSFNISPDENRWIAETLE